ncbi:MAG TPA: serine/threonine-protein kinase, partial [Steroidobacteraceae bacterium]|nr:serine/threonine-protein kinase [Steroidobacteraceae bacterium]
MASLESGKRLADRYLLQERLGDGGHAEVWAALDTRDGRRVALKFLHRASCAADDCWRVLNHEAAMARRLDHPGVLRVDAPERDGELVFLPMECADGGDVRALRGAPWRQVLPVLLKVAEILEHAHSRGVVHRDIKPGNVLLGAAGEVRVTDFGTAARTGSTLALADGSPFSASPQQLAGQAAITADDIYGLGALAYELLSRYPPYYPEFDARRVQQEMPAPLAPVHPAPPQLLAFIMAMLERHPDRRPDLGQVIDFFTRCLNHESGIGDSGAAMVVSESPPRAPAPAPARAAR